MVSVSSDVNRLLAQLPDMASLRAQSDARVKSFRERKHDAKNVMAHGRLTPALLGAAWGYLDVRDLARAVLGSSVAMYLAGKTAPIQMITGSSSFVSFPSYQRWITYLPAIPFLTNVYVAPIDAPFALPALWNARRLSITYEQAQLSQLSWQTCADAVKIVAPRIVSLHISYNCQLPECDFPLVTEFAEMGNDHRTIEWMLTRLNRERLRVLSLRHTYLNVENAVRLFSCFDQLTVLELGDVSDDVLRQVPATLTSLQLRRHQNTDHLDGALHLKNLTRLHLHGPCPLFKNVIVQALKHFARLTDLQLRCSFNNARVPDATALGLSSLTSKIPTCRFWASGMLLSSTALVQWHKDHPLMALDDIVSSSTVVPDGSDADKAVFATRSIVKVNDKCGGAKAMSADLQAVLWQTTRQTLVVDTAQELRVPELKHPSKLTYVNIVAATVSVRAVCELCPQLTHLTLRVSGVLDKATLACLARLPQVEVHSDSVVRLQGVTYQDIFDAVAKSPVRGRVFFSVGRIDSEAVRKLMSLHQETEVKMRLAGDYWQLWRD